MVGSAGRTLCEFTITCPRGIMLHLMVVEMVNKVKGQNGVSCSAPKEAH